MSRPFTAGGGVEELEEARERYFWAIVLRGTWTSLTVLLVLGVLSSLTVLLGWGKHLLLCLLGLFAGTSVSVAVRSARSRGLTSLVLGAVTLPLLAAHLAAVGAESETAFDAHSASLFPFLACATGAVLGGLLIARIWSRRLTPPPSDEREEAFPEATSITPPSRAAPAEAARGQP